MTRTRGHRDQPLTAVERADRARRIAEAKAAGATWPEVGARFGVSEKTARRAARAHADGTARLKADAADAHLGTVVPAADPLGVRAADALRAALETYGWAERSLRGLAAEGDNSSARVGAIRQAVVVAEKRIELLIAAGVIPSADAHMLARFEQRKREFVEEVFGALDRLGVDSGRVVAELDRVGPPAEAVAA